MGPPPNDRIAGLVAVLGEADTRELVALFIESFPAVSAELASGERVRCHRAAHSFKSSSQQMGLAALAQRMIKLEQKLAQPDGAVTPADLDAISAEFSRAEGPLRAFAGC